MNSVEFLDEVKRQLVETYGCKEDPRHRGAILGVSGDYPVIVGGNLYYAALHENRLSVDMGNSLQQKPSRIDDIEKQMSEVSRLLANRLPGRPQWAKALERELAKLHVLLLWHFHKKW